MTPRGHAQAAGSPGPSVRRAAAAAASPAPTAAATAPGTPIQTASPRNSGPLKRHCAA